MYHYKTKYLSGRKQKRYIRRRRLYNRLEKKRTRALLEKELQIEINLVFEELGD